MYKHLYIWSHRGDAISMEIVGYCSVWLHNYFRCVDTKKLLSDACENDNPLLCNIFDISWYVIHGSNKVTYGNVVYGKNTLQECIIS